MASKANPTNHTEIHKLLKKYEQVTIRTQTGILHLIKQDGRFSYQVNKTTVGITEKQLEGIISRIPQNIGVIGWE